MSSLSPFEALVPLLSDVIKQIFNSNNIEEQSKIAEALIRKGKEENVDEMEILLDNSKGDLISLSRLKG